MARAWPHTGVAVPKLLASYARVATGSRSAWERKDGRSENSLAALSSLGSLIPMTAYLTVREVATMARCEHKSVRRAIAAGRLRAFQPTNKLLIREDDACAWIEGRPVSLTGSAPNLRSGPIRRRPPLGSQRPGSVDDLREIERKAVRA